MMIGRAGDASALPLLRTVLQDDTAPIQTRWFATRAAIELLGEAAADVPRGKENADAARAAVLKLLPE